MTSPASTSSHLPGWWYHPTVLVLPILMAILCFGGAKASKDIVPFESLNCHPNYYTTPRCKDHPDGYGCECGPGFHWNTHKCMSSAIDSRFEFEPEPIRYTLLLGKAFPKLDSFTIAFWITVNNKTHNGTILSYKHGRNMNLLRMRSGPKLNFEIWGQLQKTDIQLINNTWHHIALTWISSSGKWNLYLNGSSIRRGSMLRRLDPIPSGGEFVLGQSSKQDVTFDSSQALDGDLSHLNIWNFVLNTTQVRYINSSCTFMYCGNAVQWVEFRSGTRGAMKMRWPSGIFTGECFTTKDSAVSCDKFCSDLIGAQCNEETKENIKWSREPAEQNISVVCPSFQENKEKSNNTVLRYATRSCKLSQTDNDGVWLEPFIDNCITDELLQLKEQFLEFEFGAINEIYVLQLADRLLNHTEEHVYLNPIDIATVIDLISILVKTQSIVPKTVIWTDHGSTYAREEKYPTFNQTYTFCELLINIVNNLLHPRNEAGWNATRPSGAEGDSLMKVMDHFANVISWDMQYHITDSKLTYEKARLNISREYVEFKIETQWVEQLYEMEFPDPRTRDRDGRRSREGGYIQIPQDAMKSINFTSLVFPQVSTFRYKNLARMLPTHEITLKSKEDRVNTPILVVYFQPQDKHDHANLSSPIYISLPILDTFNISNAECIRLRHGHKRNKWRWSKSDCLLKQYNGVRGVCACTQPGVYAISTDMYNNNWDKGDKRPQLVNFASYFGCAMSATLCLMVCGIHTYLKTSTSTAALHRNLSVAIALSHIVFMFGIDRYETPAVCHVFAILLHYFFLATYSWVMNEAFNLYIVITYSARNPSDLNDSGSMIRYYVLGWVVPAVLVGVFIGTSDGYYAKDMCWVAPDHMWLFIGPAIGIMSITILVLIFTAKEHNENSYTKSDKTNKIINIQMKAVWTQVILVSVCWAFAFISVKMVDKILKYLYALFTSLQGALFVVFYMFLHEEVRAWIKSRQKRRALQLHGFEFQDNHSLDSFASNSLIDRVLHRFRKCRRRCCGRPRRRGPPRRGPIRKNNSQGPLALSSFDSKRDMGDGQSAGTANGGGGESGSVSITGSGGTGSKVGVAAGDVTNSKEPRPPRLRELAGRKNRARIEASSDEGSDCEMISSV